MSLEAAPETIDVPKTTVSLGGITYDRLTGSVYLESPQFEDIQLDADLKPFLLSAINEFLVHHFRSNPVYSIRGLRAARIPIWLFRVEQSGFEGDTAHLHLRLGPDLRSFCSRLLGRSKN